MISESFRQFNWLDILIIIILFRISYIAMKKTFPVELFKLLGTIVAIYLALHYYTSLGYFLAKETPFPKEKIPLAFLDFVSFLFLALVGYVAFLLLRLAFERIIRMKAAPNLNRWLGLILGIERGFLMASLMTFMLVISSATYLKSSVVNSCFGRKIVNLAPNTYSWLWNKVTSKFMSGEKFNEAVLDVQDLQKAH